MAREIVISEQENIAATFEDGRISEFFMNEGEQLVGDIILGKVDSIIQSIDAAFVSIGKNRNGFIHITDLCLKNAKKRIGIKNHIHPRQNLLVQIAKEATGSKGPRLTGMLTIPGKYMVLTPYERKVGISKKITDLHERDRLVYISKKICQSGYGIIIRTEAIGQSESALKEDLDFLLKRWSEILRMSETMTAPTVLYRDQDLLYRVLRDSLTTDVEKIVVDTIEGKNRAIDLLQSWSHNASKIVQQGRNHIPLSQQYNFFSEIETALQPKAPLPSGGYLIIEKTEALTVIDVNSGSTRGTSGLNETILQTNKEAAIEIARQLKLRDIGGVIVVDFIDMLDQRHQQIIWQMLANATKNDKAQPQIGYFSEFSLLEMTRHRQKKSLTELLTTNCPYCDGVGRIRNSVYRSDLLTTESINKRLNKHDTHKHYNESANSKQMEEFTSSVEYVQNKMDTIPTKVLEQRQETDGGNQITYPKFDRYNKRYDDETTSSKTQDISEDEEDDDIEVIEIADPLEPIVNIDKAVEQAYNVVAVEEPKKFEKTKSNPNFIVELTEEERKYIESIEDEPFEKRKTNYKDKKFTKNRNDFQKKGNPRFEDRNNKPRPNNSYDNNRFRNENQQNQEVANPPVVESQNYNERNQKYKTNYDETSRVTAPLKEVVNETINDNKSFDNSSKPVMNDTINHNRSYNNNRHKDNIVEVVSESIEVINVPSEVISDIVESFSNQLVETNPISMPSFIEELVVIEEPVAPKKRGRKPNPKKAPVVEVVQTEEVKKLVAKDEDVETPTINETKLAQAKVVNKESDTTDEDTITANPKPKKRGRIKSFSPKTKKRV